MLHTVQQLQRLYVVKGEQMGESRRVTRGARRLSFLLVSNNSLTESSAQFSVNTIHVIPSAARNLGSTLHTVQQLQRLYVVEGEQMGDSRCVTRGAPLLTCQ